MDRNLAGTAVGTPTSDPEVGRVCPLDLSPLAPVVPAMPAEVAEAVGRARKAQRAFRELSLDERVSALRAAARAMLERRHEIMEIVRVEMGKVDVEALFNEALGPLDTVNAWAKVVGRHATRESVRLNPISFPKKSAVVDMLPRGVVGVIAPWNFPVAGLYRAVIPALMTGNAVVVKPSPHTPASSAWFLEVLASVLPSDLVSVVQGGAEVGEALIGSGIDACVFTGSPATGRRVRVLCAEHGVVSSIEMGGKDPAIVLADCDMTRTVAGISSWALNNAGQACGAIEIAYVDRTIADEFVERLGRVWKALRAGPGPRGEVDVAPLGNRRQLEVVARHVEDARTRGATVVCGGRATGTGLWYEPTLLDHCTEKMEVVRDETFGPVLAIIRVDGISDAVAQANQSRYGLGVSLWTRDVDRAQRIAERLDCGVVTINNHALTGAIPELPWTGTRETGSGVANSRHALATFVRPKTTVVDRSTGFELYWLPYDRGLFDLGEALSDVQIMALDRAWKLPLLLAQRMRRLKRFFGA
jgi:acyl-CoA reductase-like NAD-dependent aldehyde dehydrogenase